MQSRNFTWAAGALYKLGKDGVLRRCVQEEERIELLEEAHEGDAGGHIGKMKEGDLVLWYPGKLDARKKSLTRADALDHQVQRLCIESKRLDENNEKLQALKREQELKCRELEALTKQSLLEKENASLKMSLEIILEKLKVSDSEQERLHIKLKDIEVSLRKSIHEWDALNADHANEVVAFKMQNAANECQKQDLMEQVQEKTLQSEQRCQQMEASRNSLVEKLHGQQSQLRSIENELETVKLELDVKKVELENEKLAKPAMIQALNANAVKLKNQRGRPSGFATALDGRKMAFGNEHLANRLHWVEGTEKARPNDVPAQLFPEDKVELLKQLKAADLTGMVGDGINDAPALVAADVGIAMGVADIAIAMETADIALMTNDLQKLANAMRLGQKSHRKILQNIVLSVTTKVLVIVLAAVGYASLWGDVLADVGICLLVIFNSMMLLERKKDESACP
ncbi:hypothetical protein L7F22_010540 [Adiantum nelumboides]|nr:hypothetical protein [Adiantum nelumboides]